MSIHGTCFDNGQSGHCNYSCEVFQDGDCDAGNEIVEELINDLSQEELEMELTDLIEPVKLFTLRGAGASDLELLIKAYGY